MCQAVQVFQGRRVPLCSSSRSGPRSRSFFTSQDDTVEGRGNLNGKMSQMKKTCYGCRAGSLTTRDRKEDGESADELSRQTAPYYGAVCSEYEKTEASRHPLRKIKNALEEG